MTNKPRKITPAVAYLRTSSAANVGADKDSERRQREAIQGFARRAGYEIIDEFYDAAVSGADAIDARAGFAAMLKRIEGNGVRTIIVETASRFARDLMVQEVGYAMLTERGTRRCVWPRTFTGHPGGHPVPAGFGGKPIPTKRG
jgi:DNA invertase Pin-like site-specific DNA recombinase